MSSHEWVTLVTGIVWPAFGLIVFIVVLIRFGKQTDMLADRIARGATEMSGPAGLGLKIGATVPADKIQEVAQSSLTPDEKVAQVSELADKAIEFAATQAADAIEPWLGGEHFMAAQRSKYSTGPVKVNVNFDREALLRWVQVPPPAQAYLVPDDYRVFVKLAETLARRAQSSLVYQAPGGVTLGGARKRVLRLRILRMRNEDDWSRSDRDRISRLPQSIASGRRGFPRVLAPN